MYKLSLLFEKLRSKEILPELNVDFKKADRFFLQLFFLHWIVAVTVSAYTYSTYLLGFLGGGLITSFVAYSYLFWKGSRRFRVIVALSLMAYSALYIQQNLGRIEYHFHIFVALSFLAIYKDLKPLSLASVIVLFHHAILNIAQEHGATFFGMPVMIFNYGCGWDIVFLHGFFVAMEWYIVGWIILHNSDSFIKEVTLKHESDRLNRRLEEAVVAETKKRLESEKLMMHQSKLAMMGEMIGAIAHQWRQPLNSLGIMIQDLLIAKKYGELDDEYLEKFKKDSMQTVQRMSKTIDDFRDFFKPGKEKKEFCIEDSIEKSYEILASQFKNKSIEVVFDTSGQKHFFVGYANEFEQVILNILANSKDAILAGENNGNGLIVIDVRHNDKTLLIEISDNGGGIDENLLDRIFEPYFTTKEQGKGTGVGLYMSREIVERHLGGRLSAYNKNGGAVFLIELEIG